MEDTEKAIKVSTERHRRLKVIAARHGLRTLSDALEKFGGANIDAEFDRLEGAAPKSEGATRRKASANKE